MKIILKILLLFVAAFLMFLFFFLRIVPSNLLPPTEEQVIACRTHSCGLVGLDTPFEFIKNFIGRL